MTHSSRTGRAVLAPHLFKRKDGPRISWCGQRSGAHLFEHERDDNVEIVARDLIDVDDGVIELWVRKVYLEKVK